MKQSRRCGNTGSLSIALVISTLVSYSAVAQAPALRASEKAAPDAGAATGTAQKAALITAGESASDSKEAKTGPEMLAKLFERSKTKTVGIFDYSLYQRSGSVGGVLALHQDATFDITIDPYVKFPSRCIGPLKWNGRTATGECRVSYSQRVPGATYKYRFKIAIKDVREDRFMYDIEEYCGYLGCFTQRDLCSMIDLEGESKDCTPRPIRPDFIRATRAGVERFFEQARDELLIITDYGGLFLLPDGRVVSEDSGIIGTWSRNGLEVLGRCDPGDCKFSFMITKTSERAIGFVPTFCEHRDGECTNTDLQIERYAALSRGSRDDDTVELSRMEVIPGSADRKLFENVKQKLRYAYSEEWKGVGWETLPVLFEGRQAMYRRMVTEIFYAAQRDKALAVATAKLLQPIVGETTPKPWPGEAMYHVIVVVGEHKAELLQEH